MLERQDQNLDDGSAASTSIDDGSSSAATSSVPIDQSAPTDSISPADISSAEALAATYTGTVTEATSSPIVFTWSGTPTTLNPTQEFTATVPGIGPTTIPASDAAKFPHICLVENAVPVPIQNQSSWNQTGCMPGFLCAWTNQTELAKDSPEYCSPPPEVQMARLSGQNVPQPMGVLEPVLCERGKYCPNGKVNITCPANHFCPMGTVDPIPCFNGAFCPPGSQRNMGFLPLALLIIVDVILISIATFFKIKQRSQRRHKSRADRVFAKHSSLMAFQSTEYQRLTADNEYHGVEEGSLPLETRMPTTMSGGIRHPPTGFAMLGDLDPNETTDNFLDPSPTDTTDIHLFVQSLKKCLVANSLGLSFEYESLKFQPPKATKPILDDVSGLIHAGSLWGVMGASGAGKSTFVNVLMGKTDHTGGITRVNGVAGDIKKYKKIIGYVPQDDIVLPELTVRENILHSARIRLPCSWSDKEIQHHVDILISCLQLAHVKDSLVGSPGAPVISGGQRKRVSIGMELAAAPMALFLDEPTSGLDATAAVSIMSTLKALTRLGMTIVVVIHQPRQEIFESLDSLVLLGAGRMIYQGPEKEMQSHFEGLGFHFPDHNNPADIMGDIIAGQGRLYKPTGDASIQPLIQHWHESHFPAPTAEAKKQYPSVSIAEANALVATIKTRGAYFHKQVYYCFSRSLVQQYRMKSSFFFELGVGALAGFLIGLAYLGQKGHNFQGIFHEPYDILSSAINYSSVPQMALLVGIAIGLTAAAPGVKIFGEEKLVFWREAAAGHNRFAYYIGKVLSTAPRIFLACLHFSVTFLLLSTPRISWGAAFIANLLYYYCIYGLASCISMVTRREDGPLLAVMASLIVGVLSGASPSLENVRGWHLQWLWRASPGVWLAEAYFNQNVEPYADLYQIDLARQAIGYRLGHFGKDLALLAAIGTIYRVVAFLGLRFMFPRKQR